MFRTQYDRVRVFTEHGKRYKDTFSAVVKDNGAIDLVKDGVEDVYAFIQSYADSVDLNKIMARYAAGDVSALNQVQAHFGDVTQFPKTYAEALQVMIDAENQFMDLPLETRDKFGHDVNRFIASIGTQEWMDALGLKPVEKPVDNPVDNPVDVPVVKEGVDVV